MTLDNHMGIDLAVIDAKHTSFWHAVKVIARDEYGRSTHGPLVKKVRAVAQDLGVGPVICGSLLDSFKLAYNLPCRTVELAGALP